MNVEIVIQKDIPVKQIQNFEKKVVYNTAVYTREFTKGANAFPYLSGRLQQSEIAAPIIGSGMEYGLSAGVSYAVSVWNKTNANWTNPSTQPQWYYSVFKKQYNSIVNQAVNSALKEIK
jgi:hypothetical protein